MTDTIPTDWEMRTIGDLIEESRIPATTSSLSKRLTVRLHLKGVEQRQDKATDIDGATKYFVRKSGQFIYGKQNLHKGAIGLVPHLFDGFFSTQDIPCFDFHSDCDPNWFLNFFSQKHFYESLENIAAGTGSVRIHPNELFKVPIPVPPVAQQEKIADILTSVDDTIEHTQAQVSKLQNLKTATMNELLTRGIGHMEFRESELGLIPTTWETKKLGAVVEIQSGQVDPTEKPFSDLPHIGSGNMVSWTGQLVDVCSASQAGQISGKYHFSKRHILYSKVRPNLAKACYPKYEGVCSADTYPLMPDEVINGDFLLQYLLTETFTRSATEISARTGMPKINREDLNMISVPIPPLVEQEKIAEIFTSLDDQIEAIESKLLQLESLKKSLMGDLLTGRVRVSVD